MTVEQLGLWAGFVLTLMVFSYILGDNFLYRLAVYVFVGLAAGFIAVITVESILAPWINGTLLAPEAGLGGIILGALPLILGALLLFKSLSPGLPGRLGNIAMALLIGVGTAVTLVGVIAGTLLPLAGATASVDSGLGILNSVILFVGVACTLVYFQYLARRDPAGRPTRRLLPRSMGVIGEGFVVVTLGALYAGAILTSLTVLSERAGFLIEFIRGISGG